MSFESFMYNQSEQADREGSLETKEKLTVDH